MDLWTKAQDHEDRIKALEDKLAEAQRALAAVEKRLTDQVAAGAGTWAWKP